MAAAEVVDLLMELVPDGGDALEKRAGTDALEIAQEIEGALMAAMEGTLANVLLWEQFLSTPAQVSAALASVLQTLVDEDPMLAEWLDSALVRFKKATAS
jgi:hypothetical protein